MMTSSIISKLIKLGSVGTLYSKPVVISNKRLIQHFNNAWMSTNVSISQTKKDMEYFQDTLPSVIDTIVKGQKFAGLPSNIAKWAKEVLEYNLRGGKRMRGIAAIYTYEMLEDSKNITEESMRVARSVGWCVELFQAHLLVLDDIMDSASTRRGVPCWYKLPGVGLFAVNDAIIIHTSIIDILRANCKNNPYYVQMLELINDVLVHSSIGQHMDCNVSSNRDKKDYSLFTIDTVNAIAKYKTAFYTYQLPIRLGMYLAGKGDENTHKMATDVCMTIGQLFQMQDDFIDYHGDFALTGKDGTDIKEGKCTWPAVTALEHCTDAQKIVFTTCYGSEEPAHIERIKRLYHELGIPQLYREKEQLLYDDVISQIRNLPADLSAVFLRLLDYTYKRKF